MIIEIAPNIFNIQITLPNNPLKYLNSYVFKGDFGRNLLIDTGFNLPSCTQELINGMAELSLSNDNTDVLLSHAHVDHCGNAAFLEQQGYKILMSEIDYNVLFTNSWPTRSERAVAEGTPKEIINDILYNNPAAKYNTSEFHPQFISPGDILSYGGYDLKVILTPGHTPGQICLLDNKQSVFFSSDHVLFDITPNINTRGIGTDALGDYLNSLELVKNFPSNICLPSHRTTGNKTLIERIEELKVHHEKRLDEIIATINSNPGINAYAICSLITWKIRSKDWESFPTSQKWFAISETLAHLDYLEKRNIISRQYSNDLFTYF